MKGSASNPPGHGYRLGACITVVVVIGLVLATSLPTAAANHSFRLRYSNPVFKPDFPDPMVLRLGKHNYYAYATSVGWEKGYFPILHSTDFVHWRFVADAFKIFPSWSNSDFWAPDVIMRGNTYFFYYVGHSTAGHCIAVATSRSPAGPYKDQNIIGCGDKNGNGWIDPALFIDSDGKSYLYVSVDEPEHTISVIPMKDDLIHAAGPSRPLFGVTQRWEHGPKFTTVEGPFTIRHGDLYYIFYSGNDYNGAYGIGYATSTSPTGPFTKYAHNPILKGNKHVHGPGGGSVVEGPDGNLWMVYHGWPGVEGYNRGGVRDLRIDPLIWHGNEVSIPIHPK